ncbi:hypothetical protein SNK03_009239 [Fusarium graminearum]
MQRDKKNQHVIVVADPELNIEEEDKLGTRRTKTSKKSKFQSVAPKAVTDTFQLDSDESETAADIACMQEQPRG